MRVCVFGLGAVGGFLASRLARNAELELSAIARGRHLEAVRGRGLTVLGSGSSDFVQIYATDQPEDLGFQGIVFNCLKAQDSSAAAVEFSPLLGPETVVVNCQNGLPWWYFDDLDGPWNGRRLASVDPEDRQRNAIGAERVIGCCVYPAGEIMEPGIIRHLFGNRLEIGEPSGASTARLATVARVLKASGLEAPVTADIRSAIWTKLWGNISFNSISALTRARLDVILADPGTCAVARVIMKEAQAVGERVGAKFPMSLDERLRMLSRVGAHRTSMLQDLESGKAMEIEAMIGAVQEVGRIASIETPFIDAVLALLRQLEETLQGAVRRRV